MISFGDELNKYMQQNVGFMKLSDKVYSKMAKQLRHKLEMNLYNELYSNIQEIIGMNIRGQLKRDLRNYIIYKDETH